MLLLLLLLLLVDSLYLPTESLFDECCATLRHGSVDFDARMPTTGRPKSSVQESPLAVSCFSSVLRATVSTKDLLWRTVQ
jgi:hypothetical protein